MKRLWVIMISAGLISAHAATVTYDLDTGLNGDVSGTLNAGAISFTHGSNSEVNANRNAQRAWYSEDPSGDDIFYISGRSSDNKGIAEANLNMTVGAPSYVTFTLTPEAEGVLDFSSSTFSVDVFLLSDTDTDFLMAYQIWADTGSGWNALDGLQTNTWVSGSGGGTLYEVNESSVLTLGNAMSSGAVANVSATLNFDIAALGVLGTNQAVDFALALSGTRDNHFSFNSGIDDIVLTVDGGGPEKNYSPVAGDDAYSIVRGSTLNVSGPGVLMNDEDADGDVLSAYLVSDVSSGSLTLYTNGSFDYIPAIGFTGTVVFSYAAVDGSSTGNTATATIQVLEPIAVARPNILIFFADDMGRGDSRVYNKSASLPPAQPTIEAFAASGMVFNDAHTQAALCAPSRYSILTGNYPWRGRLEGGSWHMNKGAQVMPGQQTLAHVLNSAGYHTSIFGKGHMGGYLVDTNGVADTNQIVWNLQDAKDYLAGDLSRQANYYDPSRTDWSLPVSNGVCSALFGFDYGYMIYGGIQDPLYAYFENDYIVGDPNDLAVWDNPNFETANGKHWTYRPGYGITNWYTCDVGPSLTQKTMSFIDAHVATNQANGTDDPFFIHYCAEAVHGKHTPPVDFLGTPVRDESGDSDHADMLIELEVAFSNLLQKLESKGLLDDTLVIFTSDNGGLGLNESASNHNPNEGLRGYKASIWEGGHAVPLFIKWGDNIPAGSYDHMVGVHDLYATLAQLVGKQQGAGQGLDAVSLLSVLLQGNDAPVRNSLLMRGNSINKNTQDLDPSPFFGRAIREGTYKMIWDRNADIPLFLYNLANDPSESTDLLSDPAQAQRVARMTTGINDYVTMINDPVHPSEAARSEPLPSIRDLNENGLDDDWEVAYFGSTNAVNGGPMDDYEPDGIINLLEFAFGSNPIVVDDPATVLPDYGISGDTLEYIYRRRQDAAARNLYYSPEQTGSLISNIWTSAGLVEAGSAFVNADIQTVTNHFPIVGTTNRFFRMEVEAR